MSNKGFSRGQAAGLAMGLVVFYPFITLVVCLLAGPWGLLVYPALVALAALDIHTDNKRRAQLWDTNE